MRTRASHPQANVFGLSEEELRSRDVDVIDIVNDKVETKDYVAVSEVPAILTTRPKIPFYSALLRLVEGR
jgi:hypothetical protein